MQASRTHLTSICRADSIPPYYKVEVTPDLYKTGQATGHAYKRLRQTSDFASSWLLLERIASEVLLKRSASLISSSLALVELVESATIPHAQLEMGTHHSLPCLRDIRPPSRASYRQACLGAERFNSVGANL